MRAEPMARGNAAARRRARVMAQPPEGEPAVARSPSPHRYRTAALLFALFLGIYLANLRGQTFGDTIPNRLLPFSILIEGNLDLDEFAWVRPSDRTPHYLRKRSNHLYSGTTVALPILITPMYAVPAWLLSATGIPYEDVRARLLIAGMERLVAALITATSGALLFLVLSRLFPHGWALAVTFIFALGTNTWVISSQALWPHTLNELAIVLLTALFLGAAPSRSAFLLAGAVAGIAVANRPQMLGFALLALAFVWLHHRRHLLAFLALPSLVAVLLLAYNLSVLRFLAGVYWHFDHFGTPLLTGAAGLLVSPNRGLLVFAPVLVFTFAGAVRVWRQPAVPPWIRYLVIGLALHLALYAKFDEWWAGYTYGPRYMTGVLPAICILLAYGIVPFCRTRLRSGLVILLALYGVAVQVIGVYFADDDWNRQPVSVDVRPERVWDWSDWQVLRAARSGWKGAEMLPFIRDAVQDSVPALLRRLTPEELASELRVVEAPAVLAPAARSHALVELSNESAVSWPAFTGDIRVRYAVVLVARWLADGAPVEGAGDVRPLPENLAPREAVRMQVAITAPADRGEYVLELRVAQALDGTGGIPSKDALAIPIRVE